jgi:hypothetical protein
MEPKPHGAGQSRSRSYVFFASAELSSSSSGEIVAPTGGETLTG